MNPERREVVPPPPPPQQETQPQEALKERDIQNPEDLSAREFSKQHLATERSRLAAEIVQERREGRDKLAELKVRTNLLKLKLEQAGQNAESVQADIEALENQRVERANSLAGRFRGFIGIEARKDKELEASVEMKTEEAQLSEQERTQAAAELEESLMQLIDADEALAAIREKIPAHYAEAGDRMHRTVEQTMLRNNAFFVHTINEHPKLRHNDNSNVSGEATFDDDLDILLSLEPSVSASSLTSGRDAEGRVNGLWSPSGVLIAGGNISAAAESDIGSLSHGIKNRYAFSDANKSAAQIDEVVHAPKRGREGEMGGYNEMVIDNPEIAGYFKQGAMDEDGTMWMYDLTMKTKLQKLQALFRENEREFLSEAEVFSRNVDRYTARFNQIKERGIPFYVMTPDRRFFEVMAVNQNGSLSIGAELTPEQAAKGKAGLPPEKRKEIGQELLKKEIFKDGKTKSEAESIVREL